MNGTFKQLCSDHKHMQTLLDVFEHLLQQLGKHDRDPATLSLIMDALDYFSVYPDQWHHPIEDLVFEHLLGKPVDVRDVIHKTLNEHEKIAAATRRMNQLFYAVANDAAVERELLFGAARDYIELQRRHLKRENEILFPLVAELLTPADWHDIRTKLEQRQSAHFTEGVKKLYESAYRGLAELATEAVA
ncbi:hemerythrin domain-containing protein [Microbulbifer pacificus]|uniref:Hemerythrin domain-containing protein n=1 Tax=Microbulbifer pacificus TaxID=407164 RepID=A0AAU0MYN1_9GAMM|nr:hemerythrin domain-containing protein [Microbulbifer pacificus]WOX04533.1 hemerythrin domain-containing protein [Microbulbifer pacificus]